MNRAVSGTVVAMGTDRPLPGLMIVAGRLDVAGVEALGWTVSGPGGRFRIQYPPQPDAPDLVLHVYHVDGRLLFAESPHRCIVGAELCLRLEVPLAAIQEGLH